MLKIRFSDNRQKPFWIMEKSYSIGRSSENHLTIDDESVAPNHARLFREGDQFILRDLADSTGTYVNGNPVFNTLVSCGDILQFGNVSLEIIDPLEDINANGKEYWSLIADSSWLTGHEFQLPLELNKTVTVGRGNQCDIVIPGTHLSRLHAQITLTENALILKDLNSANGTFVNDRKIIEQNISPGDRIRLDIYSFRVFGPGIRLPQSATTTFMPIVPANDDEPLTILREDKPKTPQKPYSKVSPTKKVWKTRPTSPGNREEPTYNSSGKILAWIGAMGIVAIFAGVVFFVVSNS